MSLNITRDGRISPCTAYSSIISLVSETPDLQSFFDQNSSLQELRQHELSGSWMLPGCQRCKASEPGISKMAFNRWMSERGILNVQPGQPKIEHVGIELSNLCNLTCVMCDSEYSSSWNKHDKAFNENNLGIRNEANTWSLSKQQVNQIVEFMRNVPLLEIKGGEPLLDPNFGFFLDRLNQECTHSFNFGLVTNFTLMNDRFSEQLAKIPGLNLSISIDGIGKTYEWIRGYPFQNLEDKLLRYLPEFRNHSIFINFTSSCYNLHNIEEFYFWVCGLRHKTGTCIDFNFGLIADHPAYVSPHLSEYKSLGLKQIERIESLEETRGNILTLRTLKSLRQYLETEKVVEDEVIKRHRLWHEHLVKMRGWDIYADPSYGTAK